MPRGMHKNHRAGKPMNLRRAGVKKPTQRKANQTMWDFLRGIEDHDSIKANLLQQSPSGTTARR